MGPRKPTRQQIIDWLGAAAEQAEHAEIYHTAAANPQALDDGLARRAARDAAAMQLIELAGCAESFTRDRGEPGTTLARLDNVLRPLFEIRAMHVHPEIGITRPAPVTSMNLSFMMGHLKAAVRNLDPETFKIQAPDQRQALKSIYDGLTRIEKDGLPDPAALRSRDLHYAGYYHEIQFGRLAKATGLYENWNSPDPRHVDVNRSIFDADDMAHKFLAMRSGPDKSGLPVSVVSPEHRNRVPGRSLSELIRELRHEYQRPEERLDELAKLSAVRAREEYRNSVRGLAQQYVRMTGGAGASAAIHDYVQRQKPPLDREMIDAMRQALQVAADPGSNYLEAPEAVRDRCVDLCLALDRQGDGRLLNILDAADGRDRSRDKETEALIRGLRSDMPMSKEAIDYDPWAAVYQPIPPGADAALLRQAYGMAVQCAGAVAGPPGPARDSFAPHILFGTDQTREQNFEHAVRRIDELDSRLRTAEPQQQLAPDKAALDTPMEINYGIDSNPALSDGETTTIAAPKHAALSIEFSQATIREDPWTAVYLEIPANAGQALLSEAHYTVVQCCQAVSRPPDPFDICAPGNGQTRDRNFENAVRRLDELNARLRAVQEPDPDCSQANGPPSAELLSPDEISNRLQRILGDPTLEAAETDPSVLQALQEYRAAAQAPIEEIIDNSRRSGAAEDLDRSDTIEYDRWTGEPVRADVEYDPDTGAEIAPDDPDSPIDGPSHGFSTGRGGP